MRTTLALTQRFVGAVGAVCAAGDLESCRRMLGARISRLPGSNGRQRSDGPVKTWLDADRRTGFFPS